MEDSGLLDRLPLWGVLVATVALILLSIEAGYRLGSHRRRWSRNEDKSPLGEMVAATLGLVAFMLAFTFGLAASRFDVRRGLVLDEANAIGTTYLRTALIPEPHRSEAKKLLREYVELRVASLSEETITEGLARSRELQDRLWSGAAAAAEKSPNSIAVGLFIQSLNEVIDLHAKRIALGMRYRIPGVIWAALYFVACVGMAVMGYHSGLAGSGRSLAVLAVVLTFSAVMVLIADLDRPHQGLLQVDQTAMIDLQRSVKAPGP